MIHNRDTCSCPVEPTPGECRACSCTMMLLHGLCSDCEEVEEEEEEELDAIDREGEDDARAIRTMSDTELFTARMRDLIRCHGEGEPVYAEMAARIDLAARDPFDLLSN